MQELDIKLDVPLIQQRKNSVECGVACLNMILKYYQLDFSYDKTVDLLEFYGEGLSMPQLGTFLQQHNFKTSILTLNPLLFSKKEIKKDKNQILSHLSTLSNNLTSDRDKKTINYFISYLNIGGNIIPKIPTYNDVVQEIQNQRPIIALLTTNFLQGVVRFNFHFNVIKGISNNKIIVNDPQWDEEQGGEFIYDINDFLFALYTNAYGDLDNASLLLIEK